MNGIATVKRLAEAGRLQAIQEQRAMTDLAVAMLIIAAGGLAACAAAGIVIILDSIISRCRKSSTQGTSPMAAVDLSPIGNEFEAVSAYLAKLASGADSAVKLQADLDAEKAAHAATQTALDAANADLAKSQADVVAMAAKYASLVPAA